MTNSSSEEEFELNYIKLNTKNEIRLVGKEDYELETIAFMMSTNEFKDENIGKKLSQFIKRTIPESSDILKLNIEYCKQITKLLNADKKKNYYSSVNHILSVDFKDKFIFNKTNLLDVSIILINCFNELKKYKINTPKEFKAAISKIEFKKYDFYKIFANVEYIKNKEKIDMTYSRGSSQCKSTTMSSIRDINDEVSEIEEFNVVNDVNRYHNEQRGRVYIDNNKKNIMHSSMLTSDYNYNEEEEMKKILTKDCFIYPKSNNKKNEQGELPQELILLLSKLKNIKTLVFQIKKIDEPFLKMANLILMNVKWLFMNGIEEIIFDLGNEEMQKGLCELFAERTAELYTHFQKENSIIYYTGSYQARTINCWEPEEDIFFQTFPKEENKKKSQHIYSSQPLEEASTFDNHLCNIYNEFGNLTNLKYIRPIYYTIKNKFIDFFNEKKIEDSEENLTTNNNLEFLNISVDISKLDKESISITPSTTFNVNKMSGIPNLSQNLNANNQLTSTNSISLTSNVKSTPQMILAFVNKYRLYLEMIAIYSHYLSKNLRSIKKLNLFFHTPFSYEICQYLNMSLNFDNSHFLIFTKEIENLSEANFSFNSLDDKSFQYIIGIISNNLNITSLKLSFFTPDINYYDYSLFNLCSSKKISLTKLFQDQNEFEIKNNQNKERRINQFILNDKLLNLFCSNLCNFFNSLKAKSLNKLEEFIMRFDIPIPLLDNENYIILLIKFLINVLILITFQDNKIHTLKILAPYLKLDCSNMPYIRQFFKEISLKDEIEEQLNDQNYIKERKKIKQRTLKELREKENELKEKRKELKEKSERKELLEKLKSKEDIIIKTPQDTINEEKNEGNNEEDYDPDKIIEKYEHKRFNSDAQKKQTEHSSRRLESISVENISSKKRSELNNNTSLQNLVIQLKIYNLPEIFNLCLMNNLSGLKQINLGSLDEMTFVGFMNDYKKYCNKLLNLTSLKITLSTSLTSFINLEKYVIEYININTPKLQEKFLFSDLIILNESKMKELFELVYLNSIVNKLVIQIGYENEHILSKVLTKYINEKKEESKTEMYSLLILMELPEYHDIYNPKILDCLSSFYGLNKNKAIIFTNNSFIFI